MEAKCRSYEVDDRPRRLQLDSCEVAIPAEITLIQMTPYARQIVRGLQRQGNVFTRLSIPRGPAVPIESLPHER
jgi:hypothetical protein